MGLDAVVYRNIRNLDLQQDEPLAQVVPETGEVNFESRQLSRKYLDIRHAAERRLGNLDEISALREEVTQLVGTESFIIQKVLYSAFHGGDFIPVESLPALLAEIGVINGSDHQSSDLRRFVNSLEELIQAAKGENNPIVFV